MPPMRSPPKARRSPSPQTGRGGAFIGTMSSGSRTPFSDAVADAERRRLEKESRFHAPAPTAAEVLAEC